MMNNATLETVMADSAHSTDGSLPFVETFGPTIQGEGPAAGQLSTFVRFGGCNLSCSWCDSAYTWDGSRYSLRDEITMLSVREIVERMPDSRLIIVTGGEPLLNQKNPAFIQFLTVLKDAGKEVHVETNGTIRPTDEVATLVDHFSVSPKLGHAGMHKKSQSPVMHTGWADLHEMTDAHLKVVVITEADVEATVELARKHGWPAHRVWVMPEGTEKAVLDHRWPLVCDWATKHGVNATHRLHVLSWGDERGH